MHRSPMKSRTWPRQLSSAIKSSCLIIPDGRIQSNMQASTSRCVREAMVRWMSIVAFARDREDTALWGRCGFLDHFRVTFDGPGKHFTIRMSGPFRMDSR